MRKATGNYHTYSIRGNTATLVPEFAMEDLPSAELQPRFLRLQEQSFDDVLYEGKTYTETKIHEVQRKWHYKC